MPVHDLWNPALLPIKNLESSSGDDNEANRFLRAVGKASISRKPNKFLAVVWYMVFWESKPTKMKRQK